MNPPKQSEEALFEAALALPSEQRAAYPAQACAGDAALRQQVEALLQAHGQAGPFMAEPAAPPPGPTVRLSAPVTEKAGDKVGHYKLLQQLGDGGYGVVYTAWCIWPSRRNRFGEGWLSR